MSGSDRWALGAFEYDVVGAEAGNRRDHDRTDLGDLHRTEVSGVAELLANPFPAAVVGIDVENLREQAFIQSAVRLLAHHAQMNSRASCVRNSLKFVMLHPSSGIPAPAGPSWTFRAGFLQCGRAGRRASLLRAAAP